MSQLISNKFSKEKKIDRTVDFDSINSFGASKDLKSFGGWNAMNYIQERDYNPIVVRYEKSFDLETKVFYKDIEQIIETKEGSFIIDRKLNHIYDAIEASKNILALADDWDEDDASGCNELIYDRAVNLLIKYSQNVLKYHSTVINAPEINIGKDGSIDLEWRNEGRILLINILNKEDFEAHYYGSDFKTETIIKGFLKGYVINRNLSFWMQSLV